MPVDTAAIRIDYQLLFAIDPTHRGLLTVENGIEQSSYIIGPDDTPLSFTPDGQSTFERVVRYTRDGIYHIAIGWDHILFVITLLLPSVLVYRERQWQPSESFKESFRKIARVVTMFTVAHSITLWMAVTETVVWSSSVIESSIAASIVAAAALNLNPGWRIAPWAMAGGFGLIHGFGFAGVLADQGLNRSNLFTGLLGFNVGVEVGQLAIVLVLFPIMFAVRRRPWYRYRVLDNGSVLIALVGAAWFVERAFGLEFMPF